jgi:hypothetical protein
VAEAASNVIEIVSPVADAMSVLAELVREVPGALAGASIAKSERGSLLLNRHAWALFGPTLRERLPQLVVSEPARPESAPLKFIIQADDDSAR